MAQATPATKVVDILDLKTDPSGSIKEVTSGESWLLIEEGGEPVAAVVSVADLEQMRFQREWDEATDVFDRIGEAFKDVDPDELQAEIDRIVTEIRAESLLNRSDS
jgi:hypothetical protein